MMINYTSFHTNEYDVVVNGSNKDNIATQLRLTRKKHHGYYIKFYNQHYLCIDNNGLLFACRNKDRRLYFKFKKQ